MSTVLAAIFDMDGLLVDSEVYWERARRHFCASRGCVWSDADENSVKGHNSREWAQKMKDRCALTDDNSEIISAMTVRVRTLYDERLPILPGAVSLPRALHETISLGLASSSPRDLIDYVLDHMHLDQYFEAVVSADSVERGKPAPDVFIAAARELGHEPENIIVFEDSTAGIRAGHAAGMRVIVVPNPHFPPAKDALQLAHLVLASLADFTVPMLASI